MTTLMEARLQEWHDNAIAQGVRQGIPQGYAEGYATGYAAVYAARHPAQEGIQQDMQEGIQQGVQEGIRQGMQQGIHQGQADLLCRQAERQFDAETARRLSALLAGIEAGRLLEVGDWIFECGSGGELLDRVRQASGLARRKR